MSTRSARQVGNNYDAAFRSASPVILFPGAAKARVAYRLTDSSCAEIVSWQHVYMLRLTPAGWRTAVSVADGEMAAWAARGVSLGG